jgi:glutamate-ammonia-ligase adenylyltransferase
MPVDAFASHAREIPRPFDVARAERTFESLGSLAKDAPSVARAVFSSVFGNSPYLARLALREPELLRSSWEDGPARVVDDAIAQADRADAAEGVAAVMAELRIAKRRAALGIALADVAGLWDLDDVTRALTRLADASAGSALRIALGEAAASAGTNAPDRAALEAGTGLVVLAMGKAGAFELNYSSDIDLIAFYDIARFPFRKRNDPRGAAVDVVKTLVRLLSEVTQDGYAFRVDLRLRPDAGATQVAISTEAAARYYEEMGQNWERAALIKARICAGDRMAGEAFLREIAPFVWRRSLDYAAIDDIHSIKRQIHAHEGHGQIAIAGHNLKLGRGGIREIEFFAQTQQLILGGRNPSLRSPRTLDAINALHARGLVSGEAKTDLAEAYAFLRRLEHRLQMVEDEQTHTLPKSADALAHIACFAGFAEVEEFGRVLRGHLERVQGHYARLFERAPSLGNAQGSLVFTGVDDDPDTIETLGGLGFRDPRHIAGAIRGWHHGRIRATRSARARELLTKLVPALLDALAATADPDSAFAQFDRFVSRLPAGVQLFSLLTANPDLLRLIAPVLGSAPRLADHLARSPGVLDALMDRNFLAELPEREALDTLLAGQLAASRDDHEMALNVARRVAHEQMFRVGVQLIQGVLPAAAAGEAFANIAESVIAGLLARVQSELASTAGRVEGGAFCVLAMGKLGGREMTASSDIDLIFIYDVADGCEQSNGGMPVIVYYARLAQRLIAALTVLTSEGGLYEVDMRLRPTGNKGPVAVSLESFERYHTREAWTWERLALTRARVIAGPELLRQRIEAIIRQTLTRAFAPVDLVRDVREMRNKVAAEFPGRSPWDLKYAPGGLVDIEFAAQYLQLCHGRENPSILEPNTVRALEAIAAGGFVSGQQAPILIRSAKLQQSLIQVLRIAAEGAPDTDHATTGLKALLARAAGAANFTELEQLLAKCQSATHAAFNELIAT